MNVRLGILYTGGPKMERRRYQTARKMDRPTCGNADIRRHRSFDSDRCSPAIPGHIAILAPIVPIVVRIDTKCNDVDVKRALERGMGQSERQDGYVVKNGEPE